MLAQRYPDAYDGIAAGAPAIYWTEFLPGIQWAQQIMSMLGEAPHECEIDALVAAAVSECDGLDGVVDGIIGEVEACLDHFDPFTLVGSPIECSEVDNVSISDIAATVVNATWNGMRTEDGKQTSYGIRPGADLTGNSPTSHGQPGIVKTNCTSGTCVGAPNYLGLQWLQLFAAKDPSIDMSNLTHAEFDTLVNVNGQIYRSMISTSDPDLSRFRDAGGKMVTFHGLVSTYQNHVPLDAPNANDAYRRIMSSRPREQNTTTARCPLSSRKSTTSTDISRPRGSDTASAGRAGSRRGSSSSYGRGWRTAPLLSRRLSRSPI